MFWYILPHDPTVDIKKEAHKKNKSLLRHQSPFVSILTTMCYLKARVTISIITRDIIDNKMRNPRRKKKIPRARLNQATASGNTRI